MAKAKDRWADFELIEGLPKAVVGAGVDPVQKRRQTANAAIDVQIELWKNPEHTVNGKAPRPWWRKNGNVIYLTPRYGQRPLELRPGLTTIKLSDQAKVVPVLTTLKEAITEGEFDDQLERLSQRAPAKAK